MKCFVLIVVVMTSPNRQIFELKALHPRAWAKLTDFQKRLWCKLVEAGVPVEKSLREVKDANTDKDKAEIQMRLLPHIQGDVANGTDSRKAVLGE